MTAVTREGPLTLRISVTDRCQLRCEYCMPEEGIALCRHDDVLRYEEIVAFVERIQAWRGVARVRLTGGDPLVRRDIDVLVGMLARLGVPDLALTTNGQRLAELASALKAAGLRRVNVSLDSLDPAVYRRLSRSGDLDRTLAGIQAAQDCGLHPVKLNMVVMKGVNDGEIAALAAFALDRGCEIRYLELMPIGAAGLRVADRFMAAAEIRARLAETYTLAALPVADVADTARRYAFTDARGRQGSAGFIAPCTDSFCTWCRRLRLTADGHLIGCLAGTGSIPIRPFLNGGEAALAGLKAAVEAALGEKRTRPPFIRQRSIGAIGG